MTRAPWEADHELNVAGAEARIRSAFPEFDFDSVRYFAEGWDFRMFEVDGAWLFRFPKREACKERLAREVAVLDRLHGKLPVAIPHFEFTARDVAGYRKLDGIQMTEARCTDNFAESIARFADALHAFPVAALDGLRFPGESDTSSPEELRGSLTSRMVLLKHDEALLTRCRRAMDVPLPAPYSDGPTLVHNDLYPEHVLLNTDGSIRAVIDWGDTACADPAGEFAVARFAGGDVLQRAALDSYRRERDSAFDARARYYGVGMAIGHIQYGIDAGSPTHVQRGIQALDRIGF